jgi:hypothetical protein
MRVLGSMIGLRIVSICTFSLFFCATAAAQTKDTILQTLLSKPLFYNIAKGDGRTYAGTSEGIFEVVGEHIKLISKEKGYISINSNGKPIIDKNGIKFHRGRNYNHLLPYESNDDVLTYYSTQDDIFYLCAGGKLYIYYVMPFEVSYDNYSIRSISKHLVGTYSGIYLHNKRLDYPAPEFTNGYVREINGRGFICSYPLYILEESAMLTGNVALGENFFIYEEPDNLLVCDIMMGADKNSYYIATQNKILRVDLNFKNEEIIFKKENTGRGISLIEGHNYKIYFTANNLLMSFHTRNKKIKVEASLEEEIIAGVFVDYIIYMVGEKGLYRFHEEGLVEKLAVLEQAHSIISILNDQLILGTNLGLFHFNIVNNNLTNIIKNVEFNRNALCLEKGVLASVDKIYAGSINGLYTIPINKIPELVEKNTFKPTLQQFPIKNQLAIIILMSLTFMGIGLILYLYKKKLNAAYSTIENLQPENLITREEIEAFINENIQKASVKSIMDHFQINAPKIYTIFAPEKPGSFIHEKRVTLVKRLRQENKSIEDISFATGFSVAYLKKIMPTIEK